MTTSPIALWLSEQTDRTRRSYAADLRSFARFRGVTQDAAVAEFLALSKGEAFAVALGWRSDLEASGLAPATVARRIASLRSLTATAHSLGMCEWKLGDMKCHSTPQEDRRGPTWEEGVQILDAVSPGSELHDRRLHLWVRLMLVEALRVSEVVSLQPKFLVRDGLWVQQKGLRGYRALKSIADQTHADLCRWILESGPSVWVFPGRESKDHVSPRTVQRSVAKLGNAVLGRPVRCHGLRHTSITKAVQELGIANAMLHARHKHPQTTMRYFDAASASQLHTATALSDATSPPRPLEPGPSTSDVSPTRDNDIDSRRGG